MPVRARWHEPWTDDNGEQVPALKNLKHDIGNMLNKAIADSKTRRLFEDGRRRGFRGLDYERALMLFDALDAASSLEPLRVLQAVRLHALAGDRRGRWAMTVNRRWRVTFRFEGGDAHDVAIEDYHRG